jgi:hypothetical protein
MPLSGTKNLHLIRILPFYQAIQIRILQIAAAIQKQNLPRTGNLAQLDSSAV